MAVARSQRQHLGGDVLGQAVLQRCAIGMDDFGHASDLGSGGRSGGGAFAGHQHMHIATAGHGGRHGVEGCGLDGGVVVFCDYEGGHGNSFGQMFFE
ncbi:hypothetical protein D3C86_1868050 [compost metagenome]